MNAAHLHLLVNHFPLFAALFAGVLLTVGVLRKQAALTNAGLIFAVFAGLGAFVAAQTGERAEGIVSELPAVTEATIEDHEEAAEVAMFAAIALGAVALVALAVPSRLVAPKRAALFGAVFMSFVTFGLIAATANLGGRIRHPEIESGTATLFEGHGVGEWPDTDD